MRWRSLILSCLHRKERIARRFEGIEGDLHTALIPSLVANRLLEEDTPRYTRASDPCETLLPSYRSLLKFSRGKKEFFLSPAVTVQRYGSEGFDNTEMDVTAPEHRSRAKYRPEPQTSICTEPVSSTAAASAVPELESKAERIARYKAERRRQLAERYGISLDQEPDPECYSRYARSRKDSDGSDRRVRGESFSSDRRGRSGSLGEEGRDLYSYTSTSSNSPKVERTTHEQSQADPGYEPGRRRMDSSERERLMNLENQRRAAAPPEAASSSSYMDVTSLSPRAPFKDHCVTGMPPTSPKTSRHSSISSPKHGVSPGDMFIEQQAHNILSRQG